MAYLQGDGNGIVTIPTATATGDFSIVFSNIILTAGTEIVIGDNATNDNFIAIFTTAALSTRINNDNTTQNTGRSVGEDVKYEVSRVGGTLTVTVNDVVFSNHSFTGAFVLSAFFAYNSGSLIGEMALAGTCDMVGFGATRSYDFDGTGTTLVDTVSGENGTLTGFTTGGFIGGSSGSIEITSVSDFDAKHWDINQQAVFNISGACTATTAVEYSYDELTWFTLDAAPTLAFNGSVTITKQQSVTVRLADDTGTTFTVNNLTAGMGVVLWWQSNTEGQITNNQPITVTGNNPIPVMYKNGVFQELADPTSDEAGALGSLWPLLAQRFSDAGTPVIFANVAKGSTSIDYWNGLGTTGYGRITSAITAMGGAEFTLSIGGETDTANGMSQAEMETKIGNTVDSIFADFGVPHYLVTFPFGNTTTGDPTNVTNAFANTVANNANCLFGGNLQVIDIDTGTTAGNDGTHIKSDADALTAEDIIWTAYNSVFSTINLTATGIPDGTYEAQLWDDSVDPMTRLSVEDVTFANGTASTTLSVAVGTAIYTRIDTLTPFVTGATDLGVTE